MNSSERRMKLILMLQNSNNKLTVNDIAEKFNISRRTVFRDFQALSKMNVPVTWDKYSGYGIIRGYKIPPIMFTSKELATVMVGLSFVKSQIDETLVEDANGVELKIKEVLPDELKDFMESLEERTIVDPYMNYGLEKKHGGNWYLISSAISQSKSITFQYRSLKDEKITERKIDPYLLVFYKDHWNVLGFSHLRDDWRNFLLDRMSDIGITDQKFNLRDDFNAKALIFKSDESKHLIRVLIDRSHFKRFSANLPANIFKKEPLDSKFIKVSFYFDNLDYINDWLLQFSNHVQVLDPVELIEKRKTLLEVMFRCLDV